MFFVQTVLGLLISAANCRLSSNWMRLIESYRMPWGWTGMLNHWTALQCSGQQLVTKYVMLVLSQMITTSKRIWHSEYRASWYILIIKPTRCTNSQINFWNRTLHVSDRFSVHHQETSTVYTAIGVCHKGYAHCFLAGSGCSILIPLASNQHIPIAVYTILDSWWWT